MKKIMITLTVLFLILTMFLGCAYKASSIVEMGSPICREDFNFYENTLIAQNPDESNNGHITAGIKESTARGIMMGSSLKELKKVYSGTNLADISYLDSFKEYMCSMDGYELHFTINADNDKVSIISIMNDEYIRINEEEAKKEVEKDLRQRFGDEDYERLFG